jgi:hypothetical protein
LPTTIDAGRFVIRATHERGVGVPSSRSLATTSHEAGEILQGRPGHGQLVPPHGSDEIDPVEVVTDDLNAETASQLAAVLIDVADEADKLEEPDDDEEHHP